MEQILIFTGGMMMQHKMILDTSTGCSIENKMHEEVKELIEQMFQNQYNTSNEREPKQDELLEVDKETAYKVEIELLKRKLPRKSLQIQRLLSHCNSYARGVRVLGSSCSFHNLCTCIFYRPPPGSEQPACDVGMGICTRDCQDDCCNNKCVSRFRKTGQESCVDDFNMILCLCSYKR
ncbi:defensin protein [Trifolium repens]|nr:defensin protein [Trifolium repens]